LTAATSIFFTWIASKNGLKILTIKIAQCVGKKYNSIENLIYIDFD
jgi:hypothetical protein